MANFIITNDLFNYSWEYEDPLNSRHTEVYIDRLNEFKDTLLKLGYTFEQLNKNVHVSDRRNLTPTDNDIFLVNLSWAKTIFRNHKTTTGLLYHPSRFDYWDMLKTFEDKAINNPSLPISYGHLKTLKDLDDIKGDKVFIRPDSGNKTFTGFVCEKSRLITELTYCNLNDSSNLIITSEKKLHPLEYRFWIINNKIITHSSYSSNSCVDNPFKSRPTIFASVLRFVLNILESTCYNKGNYVLDICLVNNQPYVLETNALSTSGLYECDFWNLINGLTNIRESK